MGADLAKRRPLQTCKPHLWSLLACALCLQGNNLCVFFPRSTEMQYFVKKRNLKALKMKSSTLNYRWWNVTNYNSPKYFSGTLLEYFFLFASLYVHSIAVWRQILHFFFKYIILCYWAFTCNQLRVLTEQSRERERNPRQQKCTFRSNLFHRQEIGQGKKKS